MNARTRKRKLCIDKAVLSVGVATAGGSPRRLAGPWQRSLLRDIEGADGIVCRPSFGHLVTKHFLTPLGDAARLREKRH